ncbi:MAG: bacteriohemerythrin [Rhodospirillales bacterium]|nr:bacteriohemerythrin [Rhodospirillales bacterium]
MADNTGWRDEFSVGIEEFDTDHKNIFSFIKQLENACDKGKGFDVLEPIMNALLEYTEDHFTREEQMMSRLGYPDMENHMDLHHDLRERVMLFRKQFVEDSLDDVLSELEFLEFLREWLGFHILKEDMLYSEYFRSKGLI